MQALSIDTGIQEFQINGGGVLRFNPSDPNLYGRFFGVLDEVDAGIFEYLFGELMRSLYQRGKGSLHFTSHDLRTLETLPHHHARFASLLAEGRFYEIKAAKGENLRDLYLRSLALRSKYPGEDIPAFMRRASRLGGDE